MGWIFNNSNGSAASASAGTAAVTVTGVKVGDLIVVLTKFEGSSTTVTCSDGTSSLTAWSQGVISNSSGDPRMACHYLIASVASGSVTYTSTFGANQSFRDVVAMAYTYTPNIVPVLDGTAISSTGSGTAITSTNITTTGTDGLAFGLYADFGGTLSAPLINGVAADQTQVASTDKTALFSKTYSSGFVGAATGTISSNRWDCGVIAFRLRNTTVLNDYQFVGAGSGISVTEKIR